jgi:hypothetical protein
VDLIDEQDDAAFVGGHLLEHGLEPLLKLATELGAGQQARHVQDQNPLVAQGVRYFPIDDALCQPLHNRRLAHARLADEHGVVLAAALQHLNGSANLVIAANHRVELSHARPLGQVQRELLERFALPLCLSRIHLLVTANSADRRFQGLAGQPVAPHHRAEVGLGIGQCQQQHFAGDELVTPLRRFLLGLLKQLHQITTNLDLPSLNLGQGRQGCIRCRLECAHVGAGALQQGTRTVGLGQ